MKNKIAEFYEAFDRLDAEAMIQFYHDDIVFDDPAFGKLEGERAKNMWRMLCDGQTGKDFKILFFNLEGQDKYGYAQWEAIYRFSKTGRLVHNKISAQFEFKDGLVIRHRDKFNLYNWARQALGIPGYLIGWSNYFQVNLQKQTSQMLDTWIAKNR